MAIEVLAKSDYLVPVAEAIIVLPQIVEEKTLTPFKFWFNGSLQEGVHFQNELYYRLKQEPIEGRSKLYQSACRFAQQGAVVLLTVNEQQCSLWASLRNQEVAALNLSQRVSTSFPASPTPGT